MNTPRATIAGLSMVAVLIATGWATPTLRRAQTPSQASRLSLVPISSSDILLDLSESADGTRLISNGTRQYDASYTPKLWDPSTLRVLKVLRGHTGPIFSAEFSPDGKFAYTVSQESVRLWNSKTGRLIATIESKEAAFFRVAISGNSKRIGISTAMGEVWMVEPDGTVTSKIKVSSDPIPCIAASPDGSLFVAGGWKGEVSLLDSASGKVQRQLDPMAGKVSFVEFSSDGKHVAASTETNKVARMYEVASGKAVLERPHAYGDRSVGTTQGGATFVGKNEAYVLFLNPSGTMELFDRNTLKLAGELKGHQGLIREKKYNPEGKRKIIHLDADLFSATLFVLTTLARELKPGDILLFDEFNVPNHEWMAYKQFVDSFYMKTEVLGAVNNYYQVAFKIID